MSEEAGPMFCMVIPKSEAFSKLGTKTMAKPPSDIWVTLSCSVTLDNSEFDGLSIDPQFDSLVKVFHEPLENVKVCLW
jgi:hypothetical protein